jgi:lysine-N-methylase
MSSKQTYSDNSVKIATFGFMKKYACIQDKCINDCCNSWTIEIDKPTLEKWKAKAPDLLESIEQNPYRPETLRMQTTGEEKSCVQLQGGICSIHKNKGADMLPEICNYFPQMYKAFNSKIYLTGTTSCPAVAYIILNEEEEANFKISDHLISIKKSLGQISEYGNGLGGQNIASIVAKVMDFVSSFSNPRQAVKSLYFASKLFDETKQSQLSQNIDSILKLSNVSLKAFTVNDDFEENIFDNIIDLTLNITTRNKPFITLILQKLNELKLQGINPLALYREYEAAKDGFVTTKKYLRRFIKVKLAENFFPASSFASHSEDFIILYCEYLIIDFVIALFYSCGLKDEKTIGDIIHSIDREFYAKKRSRIMDLIKAQNLDKIENLFALQ